MSELVENIERMVFAFPRKDGRQRAVREIVRQVQSLEAENSRLLESGRWLNRLMKETEAKLAMCRLGGALQAAAWVSHHVTVEQALMTALSSVTEERDRLREKNGELANFVSTFRKDDSIGDWGMKWANELLGYDESGEEQTLTKEENNE